MFLQEKKMLVSFLSVSKKQKHHFIIAKKTQRIMLMFQCLTANKMIEFAKYMYVTFDFPVSLRVQFYMV